MGRVKTMWAPCLFRGTPCPTQKGCKRGYLVFHRERLEPRIMPWQQYSRCHFVSFVIFITGAKFEDHCSNISGDILNSVFYRFRGTTYDVITSLICIKNLNLSKTRKDIPKRKTPFFFTLKAFQTSSYYFYFIGTLTPPFTPS